MLSQAMDEEFFDKVHDVAPGARLPLTSDATVPSLPANCNQVQIAISNDIGIQIDPDYWNMLDQRNQAAMIFHEALYAYRREFGAKDSDETRGFVGRIFSTTPPTPRFIGAPKTGYYDCEISGASIFDYSIYPTIQDGKAGYILSFRQLQDATVLGRTTVFFTDPAVFASINDIKASFQINGRIHSDSRAETRQFSMRKTKGSNDIVVQVKDLQTGQISPPSTGQCQLN